jgi:hypothetical protein
MYELITAKISRGERCDKCGRGKTAFVFMGRKYTRWQKRCQKCAERMVREGKAKFVITGA